MVSIRWSLQCIVAAHYRREVWCSCVDWRVDSIQSRPWILCAVPTQLVIATRRRHALGTFDRGYRPKWARGLVVFTTNALAIFSRFGDWYRRHDSQYWNRNLLWWGRMGLPLFHHRSDRWCSFPSHRNSSKWRFQYSCIVRWSRISNSKCQWTLGHSTHSS